MHSHPSAITPVALRPPVISPSFNDYPLPHHHKKPYGKHWQHQLQSVPQSYSDCNSIVQASAQKSPLLHIPSQSTHRSSSLSNRTVSCYSSPSQPSLESLSAWNLYSQNLYCKPFNLLLNQTRQLDELSISIFGCTPTSYHQKNPIFEKSDAALIQQSWRVIHNIQNIQQKQSQDYQNYQNPAYQKWVTPKELADLQININLVTKNRQTLESSYLKNCHSYHQHQQQYMSGSLSLYPLQLIQEKQQLDSWKECIAALYFEELKIHHQLIIHRYQERQTFQIHLVYNGKLLQDFLYLSENDRKNLKKIYSQMKRYSPHENANEVQKYLNDILKTQNDIFIEKQYLMIRFCSMAETVSHKIQDHVARLKQIIKNNPNINYTFLSDYIHYISAILTGYHKAISYHHPQEKNNSQKRSNAWDFDIPFTSSIQSSLQDLAKKIYWCQITLYKVQERYTQLRRSMQSPSQHSLQESAVVSSDTLGLLLQEIFHTFPQIFSSITHITHLHKIQNIIEPLLNILNQENQQEYSLQTFIQHLNYSQICSFYNNASKYEHAQQLIDTNNHLMCSTVQSLQSNSDQPQYSIDDLLQKFKTHKKCCKKFQKHIQKYVNSNWTPTRDIDQYFLDIMTQRIYYTRIFILSLQHKQVQQQYEKECKNQYRITPKLEDDMHISLDQLSDHAIQLNVDTDPMDGHSYTKQLLILKNQATRLQKVLQAAHFPFPADAFIFQPPSINISEYWKQCMQEIHQDYDLNEIETIIQNALSENVEIIDNKNGIEEYIHHEGYQEAIEQMFQEFEDIPSDAHTISSSSTPMLHFHPSDETSWYSDCMLEID